MAGTCGILFVTMETTTRRRWAWAGLLGGLVLLGIGLGRWAEGEHAGAGRGLAPVAEDAAAAPAPATLSSAEGAGRTSVPAPPAGESAPAAPAPELRPAAAAAAGPPLGRIHGRVLGPDGQPAVGRTVRLLRTDGSGVEQATTDADGVYDQRALPASRYHVSTQPSEEELAEKGLAIHMGGLVWLAQASVVLAAGEEAQVDLGFPPERPIRVHGRLVGGGPGTSATLQWAPEDEWGYDLARYASVRADGTYELLLARPGPYHLAAIVSPGATRVDGPVIVPDAPEHRHDVVLPPGRVVVTVTAEGGAPVQGATVDLVPRAGVRPIPGMSASSYMKRTSAEGRVEVGFLRAGTWDVVVHDGKLGGVALAAARATVLVEEQDAPAEVELVLRSGTAVTGTVSGEDGAPVAGATVLVLDAAGEPLNPLQGARSRKTGEFVLTGLAPGDYSLVAARGDRWSAPLPLSVRSDEPAPSPVLTLAPAARVIVDFGALTEPSWIELRDERGRLLSGLLDWSLFSGHFGRAASTVTARYDVPPGNYTARAVGAGGRTVAEASFALVAGEPRRVTLR